MIRICKCGKTIGYRYCPWCGAETSPAPGSRSRQVLMPAYKLRKLRREQAKAAKQGQTAAPIPAVLGPDPPEPAHE